MKTLDDLIIGRSGLWFTLEEARKAFEHSDILYMYDASGSSVEPSKVGVAFLNALVFKQDFQQRARELGCVNGYRWGVEYPTNGKKPDLPDDVVVYARNYGDACGKGSEVNSFYWPDYYKFKIVDDRYKPADTSYLDKPDSSLDNDSDWYDYINQKALRLPPVGELVLVTASFGAADEWSLCTVICCHAGNIFIASGDRWLVKKFTGFGIKPAEAERKRVVDAAYEEAIKAGCTHFEEWLNRLYNAGFLRMPEDK
jgi:hypothetical protein